MKPVRIIVHTTADLYPFNQLERVDNWHRQLDFPKSSLGYWIGYTYFLERNGKVIQTRTDTEQQAHVQGYNSDSIGIGVAGNHDYERPTQLQLSAVKNLILHKMTEHSILPDNVFGHRNFTKFKTCPGLMWPESEIKQLFQPDMSYYNTLLNSLKDLLMRLKAGKMGSASSPCIDINTRK